MEESDEHLFENQKMFCHAKSPHDYDDFGTRFNSRGQFAQKHLFKCGFIYEDIPEMEHESSDDSGSAMSDEDIDAQNQSSVDAQSNQATE